MDRNGETVGSIEACVIQSVKIKRDVGRRTTTRPPSPSSSYLLRTSTVSPVLRHRRRQGIRLDAVDVGVDLAGAFLKEDV